ncbi:endonuclease/exonuclease/phosphatase family protein [Seongchinamella unica]|uniref:Endonuclease/exonuclease/phosphatase family protein n=1 Tax=Seongchinamella unica TaxID=2547392 RepID=A0A4R5LQB6_9GAMM|nr:endonuclease/exonuclease/phosphatase family protein [Seongchinamella unica]TDG12709.1 endonuclease/exonuclease/phosphatase family protein [Seongchinamella unica]
MNKSIQKRSLCRLAVISLVASMTFVASGKASTPLLAEQARDCAAYLGTLPVAKGQVLSDSVNILSWNIQKASNDGWMADLMELGSDTHLAFIQEAALQAQLGEFDPRGPLFQSFSQGYTTASVNSGVMTLSRHAPTMQCNFNSTEPWLGTPKAAAVTEHPLQGRDDRLLAINLHAVNFTFGVEDLQAQLRPLVELLLNHRGPAILAGDFNTWSDARQQLVDQVLSQHGLEPLAFDPDLRTTVFGRPLDHIYVRGLAPEHTEVIPVTSSDHNALRARLKLLM